MISNAVHAPAAVRPAIRPARQRVRRDRRRLRRAPRRGGRIAGLHDRHARRRRPFPAFRNFAPRTGAQIPCRKPERRRFDGRPPGGHPAVAVAPSRHGRYMGRRVHARLPGTLRSVRRHARRGRHDPLGGRHHDQCHGHRPHRRRTHQAPQRGTPRRRDTRRRRTRTFGRRTA